MEIVEVSRELFGNTQIRIIVEGQKPLFVAKDIESALGLKNIRVTVSEYSDEDKVTRSIKTRPVSNAYGKEYTRKMLLLTWQGLIRVLHLSQVPLAAKFRLWTANALQELITKGTVKLDDNTRKEIVGDININVIETQQEIEIQPVIEHVIETAVEIQPDNAQVIIPPRTTLCDNIDINDFLDESVVYLAHVIGSSYKFGVTADINERLVKHRYDFEKVNAKISIVKIWKCESSSIAYKIEKMIKNLAIQNNFYTPMFGKKEIITIDNIDAVIDKVTNYVEKLNVLSERQHTFKIKESERKMLKEINRGKKIDNRSKELDNENLRLKIELVKIEQGVRCNCQNIIPAVTVPIVDDTSMDNIAQDDMDIAFEQIQPAADNITVITKKSKKKEAKSAGHERQMVKQATVDWVGLNLPDDNEITTVYYTRYENMYRGIKIGRAGLTKIIKSYGYCKRMKHGGVEYWAKN
jgi:prophage antirepressor-like protein/predicted GIY-YIG superfamily endonuclease